MPQGKGSAGRVLEHLVAEAAHQRRRDHAATVAELMSLPGTTRVGGACHVPLRHRRRLHGHAARREPARRLHRRARDPEEQLQPLAREMNLSETVFVYPPEGDGHARIRIFTPGSRDPFAGHPTLGTAFVLAGPLQLDRDPARDRKRRRPGRARARGARIVFGWMEQPMPTVEPFARGGGAARRARRRALRAAGRGLRQRATARLRDARLRGRVAALRPDIAAARRPAAR